MNSIAELNDWAAKIHENAVNHGWWESKRPDEETIALVHSEWSEALEAYRNAEEPYWVHDNGKPDGMAVELIDGVIRLLDYHAEKGNEPFSGTPVTGELKDMTLPEVVYGLHSITAQIYKRQDKSYNAQKALTAIAVALKYVRVNYDMNPMIVLEAKHIYNTERPYKHGGKVC